MKLFLQALICCAVFACGFGGFHWHPVPPALLSRFNPTGVDLAHTTVLRLWNRELLNRPTVTFTESFYTISLKATAVDLGKTRIETMAPNSATYICEGASTTFSVAWQFFMGRNQYSGNNTMTVRGINLEQQMLFSIKEPGFTEVLPGRCNAVIGDYRFNLENSPPTTILLLQILANKLKPTSIKRVCAGSSAALTRLVPRSFEIPVPGVAAVPIGVLFPGTTNVNMRFTIQTPVEAGENGVSNFLNGEAFSTTWNPSGKVPLERSAFPSSVPARQMGQLVIGEYVFNSLDYALWQNGALDKVNSENELSEQFGTDLSARAVANLLPSLESYANSTLEYNDTSVESPVTNINASGIFTTERRMTEINAILEDGTKEMISSVVYNKETTTQIYIFNGGAYRRIIRHEAKAIGDSPMERAFDAFKSEGNAAFLRHLNNQYAQAPWILPTSTIYTLVGFTVTLQEGALDFACDLEYDEMDDWRG